MSLFGPNIKRMKEQGDISQLLAWLNSVDQKARTKSAQALYYLSYEGSLEDKKRFINTIIEKDGVIKLLNTSLQELIRTRLQKLSWKELLETSTDLTYWVIHRIALSH